MYRQLRAVNNNSVKTYEEEWRSKFRFSFCGIVVFGENKLKNVEPKKKKKNKSVEYYETVIILTGGRGWIVKIFKDVVR